MNSDWFFKTEILRIAHRWPWLMLFCLLGSLVGGLVSLVWPSPYLATEELFVALNPYIGQGESMASESYNQKFTNVDDYKNWQMSTLNSLIYGDHVIEETSRRLGLLHPSWADVSRQELGGMLHAYWRNVGSWRLVAETDDPARASQAVNTWEEVIIEQIETAIAAAVKARELNQQIHALLETQRQVEAELTEQQSVRDLLNEWLVNVNQREQNNKLTKSERWQILSLFTRAHLGSQWATLLESFPSPDAPCQEYTSWLSQVTESLSQVIATLERQFTSYQNRVASLNVEYTETMQNSLGLSANLEISDLNSETSGAIHVRPTGLLILIGNALGFIGWLIFEIAGVSFRLKHP